MPSSQLTELVRAAMFSALAIGLGYALLMVPNVELMTLIIFIAGLTLGLRWGVIIGGTSEAIYSILNPFGSGLMFPPLLIAQVVSMMIVGFTGGLLRSVFYRTSFSPIRIGIAGVVGFVVTFIFDSLTTLSYPISAGFDAPQTWGIYLSGLGFTILHQVSNIVVFSVGIPAVMKHLANENEVSNEKTGNRRQETEDRRQKTEDRRQKTEDRKNC